MNISEEVVQSAVAALRRRHWNSAPYWRHMNGQVEKRAVMKLGTVESVSDWQPVYVIPADLIDGKRDAPSIAAALMAILDAAEAS